MTTEKNTPQETPVDILTIKTKTKEEILIYCFGKECYESETADSEDSGFMDCTKQAMDIWSEQNCEVIHALFNNPCIELKPLEDLWRKENSPNKFVIPDRTEFYKWIRLKIVSSIAPEELKINTIGDLHEWVDKRFGKDVNSADKLIFVAELGRLLTSHVVPVPLEKTGNWLADKFKEYMESQHHLEYNTMKFNHLKHGYSIYSSMADYFNKKAVPVIKVHKEGEIRCTCTENGYVDPLCLACYPMNKSEYKQ